MKQDYLWDKTGSDPEIERLEDLLSDFRYREESASVTKVIPFPLKAKGSRQTWLFAVAACVAIGAVSLAVWSLSSKGWEATQFRIAEATIESVDAVIPTSRLAVVKVEEPETALPTPQKALTVRKRIPPSKEKYTTVSRKKEDRRKTPALTEEEKFAYGQLMLALSITSSNWQVVQDSINGSNPANATDK